MKDDASPTEHAFEVGESEVQITNRSLATLGAPIDVVVSSDDNYLSHGGGVSFALWHGAGEDEVVASLPRQSEELTLGDVVVSGAGRLDAKAIFHAVTIDFDRHRRLTQQQLSELYARVFALAEQAGYRSVGLPLIASGAGRITPRVSVSLLVRALQDSLASPLAMRRIAVSAPDRFKVAREGLESLEHWHRSFSHFRAAAARLLQSGRAMPSWLDALKFVLEFATSPDWPTAVALLLDEAQASTSTAEFPAELLTRVRMVRNRLAHGSSQPRWTVEVTGTLLDVLERVESRPAGWPSDRPPVAEIAPQSLVRLAVELGGLHRRSIHPARGPLFEPARPNQNARADGQGEAVMAVPASDETSKAAPEGSHVRRLHRLLLDQLAGKDGLKARVDRQLLGRGYQGDFELRLLEHCIRIEEPADLLRGPFDLSTLHEIYEQVVGQPAADAADSADLARDILSAIGFPEVAECHGPKQVREIIDRSEQLVRIKGLSAASAVVNDVARQLEYLCHVLLRFICQAAFGEAPEMYLTNRGTIKKPGDLAKSGLGALLIFCEQVIDDLRTTHVPRALILQRDLGEGALPKGKDALSSVRNSFSHFKPGAPVASEEDALEFMQQARQLLVALAARREGRLLPYVITIQSLEVDRWGRRTVRALNDEGVDETIFTDEPVRPGETYLMYPLSNPLRVDPILVPAGDVIWKD